MKIRRLVFVLGSLAAAGVLAAFPALAQEPAPAAAQPDIWAAFRYFVGSWTGAGQGSPGASAGEQTFAFILRGAYLQVRNRTVVSPSAQNPKGEVHEDIGVFSYDKARKVFVLRQFHVEGFVNQYVLESPPAEGRTFVFVSESIENIPAGFKARLTYRIIDSETFEQTFDLAPPGQEFTCYSKGLMKRQKGAPK